MLYPLIIQTLANEQLEESRRHAETRPAHPPGAGREPPRRAGPEGPASPAAGHAPRRRTSHTDPAMRAALTTSSQPASVSWNCQNRESGCTDCHMV